MIAVEQHTLKVTAAEDVVKVGHSTELQLQWAMQRHGIALDQCRLIAWETHQRWVQYRLGLLSKAVPDGYAKIKVEQLLKADRELLLVMAQELQQSGDRLTDTPSPMNTAMPRLMTDPRITMHLLPLPSHQVQEIQPWLGDLPGHFLKNGVRRCRSFTTGLAVCEQQCGKLYIAWAVWKFGCTGI